MEISEPIKEIENFIESVGQNDVVIFFGNSRAVDNITNRDENDESNESGEEIDSASHDQRDPIKNQLSALLGLRLGIREDC